ncbi:MAG: LamG domain-containing protein, partial [Cyanobacteria bacterium J06635_1]
AIWAKTNADVTVIDSQFYGNKATASDDAAAGAISVFDDSTLTVKGSEFKDNKGTSGGAIGTIFTELTIEDSVFENNTSKNWSGAVHADGASIPDDDRYYSGDKTPDSEGGEIIIRDSQFIDNQSGGHGGAVGIWGYDQDYVTVEGSDFIGNEVTVKEGGKSDGSANGGALRISGEEVFIKDSNFVDNTSEDQGGAVWYQGESSMEIDNTTFSGNQAEEGGAIYNSQWSGPGTTITDSTFEDNKASEGGAIYKNKNTPMTITDSEFEGNGSEPIGGNTDKIEQASVEQVVSTNSATSKSSSATQTEADIGSSPTQSSLTQSEDSLVADLSFDNVEGTTATDVSGSNNSATLMAGAATTEGVEGDALALNGKDQYAAIDDTEDINLGTQDERTISLWFRADDVSDESQKQTIYEEGGGIRGLNAYVYDDQLYVGGWNEPTQESGWEGTWLSTDKISSNEWYHLAIVLDGDNSVSANSMTASLNGEVFGQGEGSQLWGHSGDIGIGSVNGGTKFHDGTEPSKGHGLTGAVDGVQIYNDALTSNQVQELASGY